MNLKFSKGIRKGIRKLELEKGRASLLTIQIEVTKVNLFQNPKALIYDPVETACHMLTFLFTAFRSQ